MSFRAPRGLSAGARLHRSQSLPNAPAHTGPDAPTRGPSLSSLPSGNAFHRFRDAPRVPKTLAVSLENRPGAFAEIAKLLGKADVDILGFSTQALGDFGQVHLFVDRLEAAKKALEKAGARYRTREVVLTQVPDEPGALGDLASTLSKAGVNIEIAFNAAGGPATQASVVLEVSDPAAARRALESAGLPVLDEIARPSPEPEKKRPPPKKRR